MDAQVIAPGGLAPGSFRVPWAGTSTAIVAAGGGTIAFDQSGSTPMTVGATSASLDISAAAVGAWCYAWVALGINSGTVSATGWQDVSNVINSDEGTAAHYALLRRKKVNGDTTFTFSWTTSTKGVLSWASWTGLDDVTPDEGASLATNGSTSRNTVPTNSATPNAANRWAVQFAAVRTTTAGNKPISWTADAALVERFDGDNNTAGSAPWVGVQIADSNSAVTQASHSYTATHAPANESHDGTAILFLIPGAAGSGTNAPAESPTETGAAQNASVDIQVNAQQPAATAVAQDAVAALGANAGQPGETGQAFDTSVANTANAGQPSETAVAQDASSAITTAAGQPGETGSAADATGSVGATPTAPAETGTAQTASIAITVNAEQPTEAGAAQNATAALATSAQNATGSEVAADGTGSVGAQPTTPSGTGTSGDGTAAIAVNAESPTGTGTAYDATVTTSGSTNAPAGLASGTGTAQDASAAIGANAQAPTETGAAQNAQGAVGALAEVPAAAGTAADASSALATAAQAATGAGVAADGSGAITTTPTAASGSGVAFDATAMTYAVGVAVASGQAFNATVEIVETSRPRVISDLRVVTGGMRVKAVTGGGRYAVANGMHVKVITGDEFDVVTGLVQRVTVR